MSHHVIVCINSKCHVYITFARLVWLLVQLPTCWLLLLAQTQVQYIRGSFCSIVCRHTITLQYSNVKTTIQTFAITSIAGLWLENRTPCPFTARNTKVWNLCFYYQYIYDWISQLNKWSGLPFILTQQSMGRNE